MHRSGTSVFTRSLKILGLNYGKNLAKSRKDNIKGFFEDKNYFLLNRSMLGYQSLFWHTIIHPDKIKNDRIIPDDNLSIYNIITL